MLKQLARQFRQHHRFGSTLSAVLEKQKVSGKKKVVVLGSGWAGFRFIKDVDQSKFDVTIVSPRNHFLFTPLLASTTVGTLEFRAIIEPVREVCQNYIQAECVGVDTASKQILCQDFFRSDRFHLPYDYLVVSVGAKSNTFGVPGVEEHCHFLKQLKDARNIRSNVIKCFEMASEPTATSEDRKRLLSFVVVGGGPTSVEFAAELHDFISQDVRRWYPHIQMNEISIKLIEASDHILGTFDANLSGYTERHFQRQHIDILTKMSVKEVTATHLVLKDGSELPYGVCVWSTGNTAIPFIRQLDWPKEPRSNRLLVDGHMRLQQHSNIFALGDCAVFPERPLPQTAQSASQEGAYLAKYFNQMARNIPHENIPPFSYRHRGMLAYIGSYRALADLGEIKGRGFLAWLFWRSAYLTNLLSIRNKILVPMYWFKSWAFGRDVSSF